MILYLIFYMQIEIVEDAHIANITRKIIHKAILQNNMSIDVSAKTILNTI